MSRLNRLRVIAPTTVVVVVVAVATLRATCVPVARGALGPMDVRITRDATAGSYVRYDGQTDPVMIACSTSKRKQAEPTVAVDPRNTSIIVAGSNDHCLSATKLTL